MDREVHQADGWERYTVFSLWDTYRGLHPLLSRIEPGRTVDFIRSMLSVYEEGGKLPVWELSGYETNCMIGYHSAPVIADALAHGITGFDVEKAYEALKVIDKALIPIIAEIQEAIDAIDAELKKKEQDVQQD